MKYSEIVNKYSDSEKNKELAEQQKAAEQLRKKKKSLRNKLQNAKDAVEDKTANFEKAVAMEDNVIFDATYIELQGLKQTVALYQQLWDELGFEESK